MKLATSALVGFACVLLGSVGCSSSNDVTSPPPDRFVDNGNGTVTDNQTHLMWEKKGHPGSSALHNVDNTYTWCNATGDRAGICAGSTGNWIADVNGEAFAGHTDWRLPKSGGITAFPTGDTAELESIVETGHGGPTINTIFGPTASNFYWSSSTYSVGPSSAWGVTFFNGDVIGASKIDVNYVRAVRGVP